MAGPNQIEDGLLSSGQIEGRQRKLESVARNMGQHVMGALADPKVIEIMLNPDGNLWIESFGQGMVNHGHVLTPGNADAAIRICADLLDTVVTNENPILEGELPLDGSRFEAIISPIVKSPMFAIRKPTTKVFTLKDYYAQGVLSYKEDPLNVSVRRDDNFIEMCRGKNHMEVLQLAIKHKKNIIVVGGTGSGKTTFANALLDGMGDDKSRLIMIEDTRELQCRAENHALLRSSESVGMMRLLRACLRLRPDRIIVGEVRGAEALALLTAWNTGHPGGLATVHADSAEEGLLRIEQMMEQANVPKNPRLIATVCHVVVFIEREAELNAGRKVRQVVLVKGYDMEKQEYLFEYI